MDISNIKHIYYRGIATDCNYDCSYCILEKSKKYSAWDDERYLYKFVNFIRKTKFKEPVSVMFTPHGEALTKDYYYKAIAKLTQSENVAMVSCQTNGSFTTKGLLYKLNNNKVNKKKLSLWVTFHPEVVNMGLYDFANTMIELSNIVTISVGAVGVREFGNDLVIMQNILTPKIYYWINKHQGVKPELVDVYDNIDENYSFELQPYKCDIETCDAGVTSLYVKGKGEVFMCHRSKESIGNLYDDVEIVRERSASRCDCFLTYSQKRDIGFPDDLHKFRFKKEVKL